MASAPSENRNGDLAPGDPVGRAVDEPLGCVAADGRVLAHARLNPQHLAEKPRRVRVAVREHVDDGHRVGMAEDGGTAAVLHGGFHGDLPQLQGMQEIGMFFGMVGDLSDADDHRMDDRHERIPPFRP